MKTIRRYVVIDAYWDAWEQITDDQARESIKGALSSISGLKDVQVRLVNQDENPLPADYADSAE